MVKRKSLAFVLALVMVLTLIPASAFASSTNTVKDEPFTVTSDDAIPEVTVNMELGTGGLKKEDVQRIRVDLTNAEWNMNVVTGNPDPAVTNVVTTDGATKSTVTGYTNFLAHPFAITDGDGNAVTVSGSAVWAADKHSVEFSFQPTANLDKDKLIQLKLALWSGEDPGPVKVKMTSISGQLTSSEMTVAVVSGGNTTAVVKDDPKKVSRQSAKGAIVQVRETAVNSVQGIQTLELRLPTGVTWDDNKYKGKTTASDIGFGGDMVSGGAVTVSALSNGSRNLTVSFDGGSNPNASELLTITPYIIVGKDAKKGDIALQIKQLQSGDNKIENASDLVIATYGDEDVTVTTVKEADLPQVISGREFESGTSPYTVEVTLEETMANSLIDNRYIDFELPEWVQVVSGEAIEVKVNGTGSTSISDFTAVDDNSSFEWKVDHTNAAWKSNSTNKIKFTIPITVEANKSGDIELTVSGSKAGVSEHKIVVGKAVSSIEASVTLSDIKAGVQNQAVSDITLKETVAGAIRDDSSNNKISLSIDDTNYSMKFKKGDKFKAEVVSGDLEIKSADVDKSTGVVTLTIDSTSLKTPGEIKISGLEVTSNRTPAEGKYNLLVRGNAIIDNGKYLNYNGSKGDFAQEVVSIPYINVVTPADQAANASFVIGSKDYTTNGVTKTMDTAPYIDTNGRTMMPVRFVADAMGITEDQITWTQSAQTATVFGKSTVAVKVGSNVLTSNGTPITMDTVAVNNNGRVFVPVRFVANALGASVGWDAATQTVTVYTVK